MMKKFLFCLIIAMCAVLPSWGRFADLRYVGHLEWDSSRRTEVTLQCDTTAQLTTWTVILEGWVSDGDLLLLKTGDGKVIELEPYAVKFDQVTDSIGHSSITGELIEYYHHEQVLYYHITSAALDYIAEHGVSKIRSGKDSYHHDIVYERNEFGQALVSAYKGILEEMSPGYVPPQKKTIYDDF